MVTDRLTLIAATLELCEAEAAARGDTLAAALHARIPDTWPPEVFETDDVERVRKQLLAHPALAGGRCTTRCGGRSHAARGERSRAVFFRDTTVIGVVWLGENFIVARGREGALIRSSGPEELARLALALELPVKVIHVPPRGTT